jgi:hypothetical protein
MEETIQRANAMEENIRKIDDAKQSRPAAQRPSARTETPLKVHKSAP